MVQVWQAHLSGKFSATRGEWWNALSYLAEQADVITLTEGLQAREWIAEWAMARGWECVQPKGAENGILFRGLERDKDGQRDVAVRAEGVTELSQRLPSGKRVTATWAKINLHQRARPVAFVVAHLPAKVEGRSTFQRGKHYVTHAAAVRGLKGVVREQNRRVSIAFDANLNLRRPWVRAWERVAFRRYQSAWRGKLPEAGTFKGRVIDWLLVGRGIRCDKAEPLRRLEGFDHRPFVVTLRV